MAFRARAVGLVALIALVPAVALAQPPSVPQPPPPAPPPAATPTPTGQAAAQPAAPATGQATGPADTTSGAPGAPALAGSAAPSQPAFPATGYGWTETPKKRGVHVTKTRAARGRPESPDAILPGFETLADGSTRLFVELTKPVPYDTKAARGSITYVLKGAHVDRRNNYNPLVTVHFNTPVTSARLVPHGRDLWFVVALRASVQPTVLMDTTKDGGAMLRIEFAKGDYLPAAPPPPAPAPQPPPEAPPQAVTPPVVSSPR